eukprot:SAG31_NODE_2299_length_5981_cov_2.649439_5_plen_118_part_00
MLGATLVSCRRVQRLPLKCTVAIAWWSAQCANVRRALCIEWFAYNDSTLSADFSVTLATELYSHATDSGNDMDFPGTNDLENVVDAPENAAVLEDLAEMVRVGWRGQRPPQLSARLN